MSPEPVRPIPGRIGAWVLAMLGGMLLEFLFWPKDSSALGWLDGWSILGNGLLGALLLASLFGVMLPVVPYLARVLTSGRRKWGFAIGWTSTMAVWLWMTASVSFQAPSQGPLLQMSYLPVVGAFGVLPTLDVTSPTLGLNGYLSPLILLYGAIDFLWWSLLVLEIARQRARRGTVGRSELTGRASRCLTALGWLPFLGISSVCCVSPPVVSAVLVLGGPSAWVEAYVAADSLVSGLLALLSLALVAAGIRSWSSALRNRSGRPKAAIPPEGLK